MNTYEGYEEGEKCNRNGCDGTIVHYREGGCTCFRNPPCSYCTDDSQYCDSCGWEAAAENDFPKTTHTPTIVATVNPDHKTRDGWYDVVMYWDSYPERVCARNVTYEEAEKIKINLIGNRYLSYLTTYEIRPHAE